MKGKKKMLNEFDKTKRTKDDRKKKKIAGVERQGRRTTTTPEDEVENEDEEPTPHSNLEPKSMDSRAGFESKTALSHTATMPLRSTSVRLSGQSENLRFFTTYRVSMGTGRRVC